MKYTHIVMPIKCRVIKTSDYVEGDEPELDKSPTGALLRAFKKHNCLAAQVIYVNPQHDSFHLGSDSPFCVKELPPNAQEFPFGVDETQSNDGTNSIPNAIPVGGLNPPMVDELEYPIENPPIMPRSSIPDDDEIPF